MGPIKIIGHFVLHVILGSILFLVLAAAAVVIKLALDWLSQKGMPDELVHVAHYVEMFVFAVDVICFIFFVVVEAVVLCREILNEAKTPTVVGVAEGVTQK